MGLSQDQIEQVFDTIIRGYYPSRIILFGSYAKGNPTESSDLDLLIIKETGVPKYKRAGRVRELSNPQPCPMDILVYTPSEYNDLIRFKSLIPYIAKRKVNVVYEEETNLWIRKPEFPRTHYLTLLLERYILPLDPDFKEIRQSAIDLSAFSVTSRYPDAFNDIDLPIAREAFQAASH